MHDGEFRDLPHAVGPAQFAADIARLEGGDGALGPVGTLRPAGGGCLVSPYVIVDEVQVEACGVPVDLDDVVERGVVAPAAGRVRGQDARDCLPDGLGSLKGSQWFQPVAAAVGDLDDRVFVNRAAIAAGSWKSAARTYRAITPSIWRSSVMISVQQLPRREAMTDYPRISSLRVWTGWRSGSSPTS